VRDFHHRYSAERRRALVGQISRGIEDGAFRAGLDAELATDALLGALFYRRLMTGRPFEPGGAAILVDTVLGVGQKKS
jgi:hypothetical protein